MLAPRIARFVWPALVVLGLFAPTPAAMPRVMKIIPRDGPLAVIAVDSLERSDGRLRELLAAVNGAGYAGLGPLLEAMGVREGIDLSGAAAIVLVPSNAEEESAGHVLVLLPTSDAAAFFAGIKAHEKGDIRAFEYAGATYFVRAVEGSYVILGDDRAAVESFVTTTDRGAAERLGAFGPIGVRIVESADVVAFADAAHIGPLAKSILSLTLGEAGSDGDPAKLLGMFGGTENQPNAPLFGGSFLDRLMQLARSESRSVLLAVSFDPGALQIDCAATFVDDGVLRRAAQSSKDAGAPAESPLATMPAQPYLLAIGIDAAHPGVRVLADELGPPGRSTKVFVQAELAVLGAIPSMEALSLVVYEPASVMFGSLARTIVSWRAPAPEEGVRAFRGWIESLDQRSLGNAVFTSKYEPGPAGDSWTVTPPPGAFPMLPMLLGPFPEVQGKAVTLSGRAYLTWSRDARLLESAVHAGVNEAATLDRDELLARVSSMLPPGGARLFEAYFDTTPIVKQVAPMIAGQHAAEDLPEKIAPLGAAITVEGGVARLSVVAPVDVLKTWSVLSRSGPAPGEQPERPRRAPRED